MLLNSLLKNGDIIQDQYRYNRFVLMVLMCILYINVFRIYLLPLILVCYIFCDGSKFNFFFGYFVIGFVEVSLMHPLDLMKTRFQIQRGPDDPNRYTSLADCFKKMYRNEGYIERYTMKEYMYLCFL